MATGQKMTQWTSNLGLLAAVLLIAERVRELMSSGYYVDAKLGSSRVASVVRALGRCGLRAG
jgi:hypothetical protein